MRIALMVLMLAAFLPASSPTEAQTRPEPPKGELEQLLSALALAPNEDIAARMENRIGQLWVKSGGPAAGMLVARGTRSLQSGEAQAAVQDFDAALTLSPGFTEAIGRRAVARYQAGDVAGAFRDLEDAVRREPRNFAAWRSLSAIAEAQGNQAGALAAWKKLLEVDPKAADAQKRLKELTRKVEGEDS